MVALDRRAARLCLRAQQASRPHHRSECGPCGGRSWTTPTLAAVSLAISGFSPPRESGILPGTVNSRTAHRTWVFSASVASVTAVAHRRTASRSTSPAARDLIDLGDGKQHRFDGASADSVPEMQGLRLAKLLGKVREALINCQFSPPALTARPRLCAAAPEPRPPMSGTDDSNVESLRPAMNLIGGQSIGPDQNSAGKYPLISRPIQISTSVGVVQAIRAFPWRS
jgi:hypothetical protein